MPMTHAGRGTGQPATFPVTVETNPDQRPAWSLETWPRNLAAEPDDEQDGEDG